MLVGLVVVVYDVQVALDFGGEQRDCNVRLIAFGGPKYGTQTSCDKRNLTLRKWPPLGRLGEATQGGPRRQRTPMKPIKFTCLDLICASQPAKQRQAAQRGAHFTPNEH